MASVDESPVSIDAPVTVELLPIYIAELFQRLNMIDTQAQNAITGKDNVNAKAIFINVDEIVKLLTRGDSTGQLDDYYKNLENARCREAAAKL